MIKPIWRGNRRLQYNLTKWLSVGSTSIAIVLLAGCGPDMFTRTGTVAPSSNSLSGNWQFDAAGTNSPFPSAGGSVLQGSTLANGSINVDAILQVQNPGSCFVGQSALPMTGALANTALTLTSFSIASQYVLIASTIGSDFATLTGAVSVQGGCANGNSATVVGRKMAAFTGTYTAPSPSALSSITIQQDSSADGLGYFHLQGSVSLTSVPCFTSGTIQLAGSTISGTHVRLVIQANDAAASSVVATGTLLASATSLQLSAIQVTSGACAGSLGTATLSM